MLVVYGDMLSQPTRAVMTFCKLAKIPFQFHLISIRKKEQRAPSYLAINPEGKVPAIQHGEFILTESHAILQYLSQSHTCAEHWYPRDLKQRAVVDRYLHWHHTNLRHAHQIVFELVMTPVLGLKSAPHVMTVSPIVLEKSLNTMETWLCKERYVAGPEISIADVSAFCELTQLELIHYDLSPYHRVKEWYDSLRKLPEVIETHSILDRAVAKIGIKP